MVRCKNCLAVHRGSYMRSMCWTKWMLCRICAVKLHPDAYTVPYVKKVVAVGERERNNVQT